MFLGQCAFYGVATVPELLRETDQDTLLALQVTTRVAADLALERDKRLAKLIVKELADSLN